MTSLAPVPSRATLRENTDAAVGTFAEYGPEHTRPFRALKTSTGSSPRLSRDAGARS